MKKGNVYSLELCRAIAIVLVIVIHCTDLLARKYVDLDLYQWDIYQGIRIAGRLSVPLFIFLSGALIIEKASKISLLEFYKKRVPQFIFLLVFYAFLINLISSYFFDKPFVIIEFLKGLMAGNAGYAYQLWYLYIAIGLYLSSPFIAAMVTNLSDSKLLGLNLITISFTFIPPFLYDVFKMEIFIGSLSFFISSYYVCYFIVGYSIYSRGTLSKISSIQLITVSIAFFALLLYIQNFLKLSGGLSGDGFTWYHSFPIFVMASCVFALLIRIKSPSPSFVTTCISRLSESSFAIYLFHVIPLTLVMNIARDLNISIYLKLPILITLTLTVSYLYYLLIGKTRRLNFLIK